MMIVGHAVQSGQMDRVLKYRDRALVMITKLRQMHTSPASRNVSPHVNAILLNHFEMLLRENSSMCRIIMGQPESALNEISAMVAVMKVNGDLSSTFSAQVHTLLGFYGMMMRNPIEAEKQFKSALAAVTDTDLWTNIYLNLAILYLQSGRDEQFYSLLERITPERLQSAASTLLAAAHFVRALQSFFHSRHQEAKMFLKDCLALSNKDDMLRLSACALILLGRIFLASNSVQECVQMLGPGLDMAGKVPDLCLQTWATSMLRDVYAHHRDVNKASEFKQFADTYAGHIEKERIQASHNPAHRLLQWIDGPPPSAS